MTFRHHLHIKQAGSSPGLICTVERSSFVPCKPFKKYLKGITNHKMNQNVYRVYSKHESLPNHFLGKECFSVSFQARKENYKTFNN